MILKNPNLKLNIESLKTIIGDVNEVMIYGFVECYYKEVITVLEKSGYKALMWDFPPFKRLEFDDLGHPVIDPEENKDEGSDEEDIPAETSKRVLNFLAEFAEQKTKKAQNFRLMLTNNGRYCKNILTSLAFENYRKSLAGEPIIPLIFCVGLDSADKKITLDSNKLITSHNGDLGSVTDEELRRCYKIAKNATSELKPIIEKTFNFVSLKQDSVDKDLYSLEKREPFWQEPGWEEAWQENRVHTDRPAFVPEKKNHPWRNVLATEMSELTKALQKQSMFTTKDTRYPHQDSPVYSETVQKAYEELGYQTKSVPRRKF